ncbi:hypothetical protein B0T12DRAFT_420791 [Alternaria alternata]|nr:hypothetical protein B0T12DRAFT_420791 [Alternaria alternata]
MDHLTINDLLKRNSSSLTYRCYKKDINHIAGWLAWTSKQCGYLGTDTESRAQRDAA